MKSTMRLLAVGGLVAALGLAGVITVRAADQSLLNVSYDPTRELYQQFDEAFAMYERVATLDPDNVTMRWNTSVLHLLLGDFERGWAGRGDSWTAPADAL